MGEKARILWYLINIGFSFICVFYVENHCPWILKQDRWEFEIINETLVTINGNDEWRFNKAV